MSKAAELANLIGNINAGGGGVNRNLIINGAMNVAQRGTSQTGVGSAEVFTCDRWKAAGTSSGRLTMTQDSSAPSGFANSLKLDCTTADTSIAADEFLIVSQAFEGQNLQILDKGLATAKAFNVSFYVKASGVFTFGFEFYDADNGRHNCRTFATTTDWVRHSFSIQADVDDGSSPFDDDNAASLYLNFWLHGGSNSTSGTLATNWANFTAANRAAGISSFYSSTDNEFFITGVQVEVGQNPTEFEHEPIDRTLTKCQRYYYLKGKGAATYLGNGGYTANSEVDCVVNFPTTMRSAPSLEQVSGTNYYSAISPDGTDTLDDFVIHQSTIYSILIYNNSDASGSAGYYAALNIVNASGYIAFSSEL